jgi:hypothetical protein
MRHKSQVFFWSFLLAAGSLVSQNNPSLFLLPEQSNATSVLAKNPATPLAIYSWGDPFTQRAGSNVSPDSEHPAAKFAGTSKRNTLILAGTLLLPAALLTRSGIRKDARKIGVQLSEAVFLTNGFSTVAQRLVKRTRPFYFSAETVSIQRTPGGDLSYFPDRTSIASCLSFFSAKVWADHHPHSRMKPVIWAAAAAIPALTGYLQYHSEERPISDVVTDYVVGALIGYLVPHLHKVDPDARRKFRMSSAFLEGVPVFVVKYRL